MKHTSRSSVYGKSDAPGHLARGPKEKDRAVYRDERLSVQLKINGLTYFFNFYLMMLVARDTANSHRWYEPKSIFQLLETFLSIFLPFRIPPVSLFV
jgi:hypothetical protein